MAATSVLKLKVDSTEYDAGLRQAQAGLRALNEALRAEGKTFADVNEQALEYVRGIGSMEGTAKNSRSMLREMTQALTELTLQYRDLSDAEKKSPFGVALAGSLEELTNRAGAISDAMGDVQKDIANVASDTRLFDQLSQGAQVASAGVQTLTGTFKLLGIDMGDDVKIIATLQSAMAVTNGLTTIQNALQKESALMQGLAAAKTSLSAAAHAVLAGQLKAATVAQGAFNLVLKAAPWMAAIGSLTLICDWLGVFSSDTEGASDSQRSLNKEIQDGTNYVLRYVDALDSAYNSVIQYQDAIGKNTDYMELDKAKRKVEELQKAFTEMYDKRAGNSSSRLLKGESLSSVVNDRYYQEDLQKISDELSKAENEVKTIEARINTSDKALRHFLSTWDKLDTKPEIQKAISAISNFRDQFGIDSSAYKRYDDIVSRLQAKINPKKTVGGGSGASNNIVADVALPVGSFAALNKELQKLRDEQSLVTNTEEWKAYAVQIDEVTKRIRLLKGETLEVTGTSITSQSGLSSFISSLQTDISNIDFGKEGAAAIYKSLSDSLADTTMLSGLLTEALSLGLSTAMFDAADELGRDFWTRAMEGGVADIDWQKIIDKINEARKAAGLDEIVPDYGKGTTSTKGKENKAEKREVKMGDAMSQMASGLSGVVSGLDKLGVEIPKGLQDVINGIQTVTSILSSISAIVSVIEALSAADSIIPFANGGVVGMAAGGMVIPGNSHSGDRLRLPVVGGGMIGVNSGEVILNQAQAGVLASALSNRGDYTPVQPYVDGEKIFLGMNNTSKRMGQGEIVTTGMLRRMGLM